MTTRKLLQLINTFSEVVGYKISTQNPTAILYPNQKLSEKETRKTIPFTTASKIPWNKPDQEVKNVYNENFKALEEETEENTKWKAKSMFVD